MDEDDRPGYLIDYIVSWAKRHSITSGESVYQSDQVLCHNCNMAKGFWGVCPHKEKLVKGEDNDNIQ